MNGHKYVINETITTRNSPFGQSVFKVRTVDILPLDAEEGKDGSDDSSSSSTSATATATEVTGTAEVSTTAPAATGTATDGTVVDAIETTTDDEKTAVDRGSPEELEPDHRNEIIHRNNNKNERIEVVRI